MISKFLIYFRAIRGLELFLMLGSPVLGLLFARQSEGHKHFHILHYLIFLVSTYCLAGHVYAYNSWAGLKADLKDRSKEKFPLMEGKISIKEMYTLSFILLLTALLGYFVLNKHLVIVSLINALLWVLYCDPRILFKSKPILGSLIHFFAGILNFLLGYLFIKNLDMNGILLGLYFTIIFVGGHLNHEIRDYEADKINNYKTNAICWGKKLIFIMSFSLFSYSNIHLILLAKNKIVDINIIVPLLILYPLYIYFSYITMREGLKFQEMDNFRNRYRILYALYGIYMAVYLLYKQVII
ncbi:MAG: UbiA prenyltransferase family protein [Candidatus Coatesbacteria bacterium]|nr:UbiA prenyltransferase family protein [Candidatus Coatesbacteria bacterium]